MTSHCLEQLEFEVAALMAEHPPRFTHAHKQAVFALVQTGDGVWSLSK